MQLLADTHSLTGRYLRGELKIAVPARRRKPQGKFLKIIGAHSHNLNGVDVMIPLGMLVAVTGVSGSGKSTLVYDVLYKALQAKRTGGNWREYCDRIEGDAALTAVEMVDQSPIGRTPRSNPGHVPEGIRSHPRGFRVHARSEEARPHARDIFRSTFPAGAAKPARATAPSPSRCVSSPTSSWSARNAAARATRAACSKCAYKEKNIHDVLQMTVREALTFFAAHPKVTARLRVLEEVGLGYLRLGQSGTTLSGGEAQRLKLAAHLTRQDNTGILYIFDEPTTGLHFDDIQKLLTAFRKLIEGGASVLIIEHNLDVIKSADWVIDLGPEGGDAGGRVVAVGTPEQVARNSQSHTGKFLARVLNSRNGANHANHVPPGAANGPAAEPFDFMTLRSISLAFCALAMFLSATANISAQTPTPSRRISPGPGSGCHRVE